MSAGLSQAQSYRLLAVVLIAAIVVVASGLGPVIAGLIR